MTRISRKLFLFGITLTGTAVSQAQSQPQPQPISGGGTVTPTSTQSLIITDDGAPNPNGQHSPYAHWEQFSTTLEAHVDDPEPQAETTIDGPTYSWTGGSSVAHLTSLVGQSTGLQSTLGTELPAGPNSINVQCTATFTRTDTSTGRSLDPIKVTGRLTVTFLSRVPVSVRSLDADPVHGVPDASGFDGTNFSHGATYHFVVLDNQPSPQHYGFGKIKEEFGSYNPDPRYTAALASQNAPGPEYTTDAPTDTFIDHNSWSTAGWPAADIATTGKASPTDFWYSFGQTLVCLEQKPPYPSPYDQRTPLTPHFVIRHLRDSVER